jgi:hypothetical protein
MSCVCLCTIANIDANMTVWQWLSVSLSTKAGVVFGSTKDLGTTKIPLQAIAAAVLFPQNKDSPEVFHSISCVAF